MSSYLTSSDTTALLPLMLQDDDTSPHRFTHQQHAQQHHHLRLPVAGVTTSMDFLYTQTMTVEEMGTQSIIVAAGLVQEIIAVPYDDVADLFRRHRPLQRLRKLSLVQSMRITDAGLKHLAGTLKRLKHLDVAGCFRISLVGVGHFLCGGGTGGRGVKAAASVQLTHLDLNCWNLPIVIPAQFAPLAHLVHLSFAHCSGFIRDMKHLALLQNLRHLDLSEGTGVTNDELSCIATIPHLTHLNISFCGVMITDAGMEHVGNMWNLEHLDVTWCTAITDAGVACLRQLQRLRFLNVACCEKITDVGVKSIVSYLTGLRHLDLCGLSRVTDAGLASIATSCRDLRFLGLGAVELITDAGVSHLGVLGQLCHLDLSSCSLVGDAGLARLAQLTELTYLDISGCERVTDGGLKRLVTSARKLQQLRMPGCVKLTDAGVTSIFANLRLLQFLDLQDCPAVTDGGIAQLGVKEDYQKHLAVGGSELAETGVVTLKRNNQMHLLHPKIHQPPSQKKKQKPLPLTMSRTASSTVSLRTVAQRVVANNNKNGLPRKASMSPTVTRSPSKST